MSDLKLTHPGPEPMNRCPFSAGEMYTTNELAHILKVTRRTVERMVDRSALPDPVRLPSLGPRWPGGDLRAWFEQGLSKGGQQ